MALGRTVTLENEPIGIHTSLRQSHRCLTSDAWRYKQIIQVVVLLSKYVHYPSNESVACPGLLGVPSAVIRRREDHAAVRRAVQPSEISC